ncbi:MAG: hypothetical protein ACW99G_19880 [Candidatus Thorarchaeota archaeon]|jgi:hypothetical protein
MANLDRPRGLSPVKHLSGAPWNGGTWKCFFASGNAVAAYIGDPVIHEGTACTSGCCMTVAVAASGDGVEILGIITSFEPLPADVIGLNPASLSGSTDRAGSPLYRLASTARYVDVVFDPDVIYEAQGDSVAAIARTDVSQGTDLIGSGGSTVTGLSGFEIDSSGIAADKSSQLHILGAVDHPDNDISLVNADWYVLVNTTVFGPGTLGRVLGV